MVDDDIQLVRLDGIERKIIWNHRKARWIGKKYIEEVSEFAANEAQQNAAATNCAQNVVPITQLKCLLPDDGETATPFLPNMLGE